MTTRMHRGGFTLVEILIVVVILGILAAIVIPQFTNASESAKTSSLISQLQTVRSQLELFQVQHNGVYPTLDNTWNVMVKKTTATETAADDGDDTGDYGPYLQQPPVNPFTGTATVGTGTTTDWQYVQSTGAIKANVPLSGTQTLTSLGLSSADANAKTTAE